MLCKKKSNESGLVFQGGEGVVLGAGQWVPVVCPMGTIQGGGTNPPAEELFPSHPQLSFPSSTDRNPAIL